MENKNNQEPDRDFTSKGRTSNANQQGNGDEPITDISNVDQQEGAMNNGTTGKDHDLLTSGKSSPDAASE